MRPLTEADLKVVSERKPTDAEMRDLLFAWKICKHVKSNAILYARNGQTTGVGAGQMSRVDSARIGAMKSVLGIKGSVAASDAFFPFPDGVEVIAEAGATAIIQPGGSVKRQGSHRYRQQARLGNGADRRAALPALRKKP